MWPWGEKRGAQPEQRTREIAVDHMRKEQEPEQPAKQSLKGWKAIAAYLGIPVGTAQRWARTGMPLRREGRSITVNVNELTDWLGRESHMPGAARVATEKTDLAGALRESIAAARPGGKRRVA